MREKMEELQLKLDVGWVANCPVRIKQQGERAIVTWKADQILALLEEEIRKVELTDEEIKSVLRDYAIKVWGYMPEYADSVVEGGMVNNMRISKLVAQAQHKNILKILEEK